MFAKKQNKNCKNTINPIEHSLKLLLHLQNYIYAIFILFKPPLLTNPR